MTSEQIGSIAWTAARVEGCALLGLWMIAAVAAGMSPSAHALAVVKLTYVCALLALSVDSFITFPFTLLAQGRERIAGAGLTLFVGVFAFIAVGFAE